MNEKSLIVITFNPIWRSRPVHRSTKNFNICSLKSKENIIFAHNYYFKQNTKEAHCCLQFHLSISFFLGRLGLFPMTLRFQSFEQNQTPVFSI